MVKTVSQLRENDIVLLLSANSGYNKNQCFIHKVGRKYIQVKQYQDQKYNFLLFEIDTLRIKEGGFPHDCKLFLGSLDDYDKQTTIYLKRKELRDKIYNICFDLPLDKLQEILDFCQSKTKEL